MQLHFHTVAGFEAARQLSTAGTMAKRRWHGHSFQVAAAYAGGQLPAAFPGDEADTLTRLLQEASMPLQYQALNDLIEAPFDQYVLAWIGQRLPSAGLVGLRLRSAPDQGVDITAAGQAYCWQRFRFEAAHRLPHVPAGHPCGRMHGHGFVVQLYVQLPADALAAEQLQQHLSKLWQPMQQRLQYSTLNAIAGLENPTSELLGAWLWQQLQPALPSLCWVQVQETLSAGSLFDGSTHRIWKQRSFEAATRLHQAPASDPRSQLHGHSYQVRLQLQAPLDQVLGWTLDFGDVKALFNPLYERLDHHELPALVAALQAETGVHALADGSLASLAPLLVDQLRPSLPQLQGLDLLHRPDAGCQAALDRQWTPLALPYC